MPITPFASHMQVVQQLQERIRELELENAKLRADLEFDYERNRIDEIAEFAELYSNDFYIVSIDEH